MAGDASADICEVVRTIGVIQSLHLILNIESYRDRLRALSLRTAISTADRVRMRAWGVFATLVFLAFYVAFTGQLSVTESIAMVIPVAAALALTFAIHRVTERRFNLRAPWFWLVARTCASLGKDSVKVGLFLLRSLWRRPPCPAGPTRSQRFRFGDDSGPEATRRALVTLSVSASPDQYVIEMTPDDCLLMHSLAGESRNSDQDWPV